MNNIRQQKIDLHNEILDLRSIEALINSDWFCERVEDSSVEEIEKLISLIKRRNIDQIRHWAYRHSSLDLSEWRNTDLRDKAQQLRVRNYSRLKRLELIREIRKLL